MLYSNSYVSLLESGLVSVSVESPSQVKVVVSVSVSIPVPFVLGCVVMSAMRCEFLADMVVQFHSAV